MVIMNTIPILIHELQASRKKIKEAGLDLNKDRRNQLISQFARNGSAIDSDSLITRLETLNSKPDDLRTQLTKIETSLSPYPQAQNIAKLVFKGLDFNKIAEQLCLSLDQVFITMRFIERRLQSPDNDTSPIDEISDRDWNRLVAREKDALELGLIGFDNAEAALLVDSTHRSICTQRIEALKKLGISKEQRARWFKSQSTRLATHNLEEIKTRYIDSDRLFFFCFGDNAYKNEEFTGLNKSKLKLTTDLKSALNSLTEEERGLVEGFLAGQKHSELAGRYQISTDTVTRRLNALRQRIIELASLQEIKPPVKGIAAAKYRALSEQQRRIFTRALAGDKNKDIAADEGIGNISYALSVCREQLGIKTIAAFQRMQAAYRSIDTDSEEFKKASFKFFYPKGLSCPFPDHSDEFRNKLYPVIMAALDDHVEGRDSELIRRVISQRNSIAAVAREDKVAIGDYRNRVENTRRAVRRKIKAFVEGEIPLTEQWTISSLENTSEAAKQKQERLLNRVFKDMQAQAKAISEEELKSLLYQRAIEESAKLPEPKKSIMEAYIQGSDSHIIAKSLGISISSCNGHINRAAAKIKTGLRPILDQNMGDSIKGLAISRESLTQTLKLDELPEGVGIAEIRTAIKELVSHLPNGKKPYRREYLDLYLAGLSITEIPKYYGEETITLTEELERSADWIAKKLILAFPVGLAKAYRGAGFALMSEKQQLTLRAKLAGYKNAEIAKVLAEHYSGSRRSGVWVVLSEICNKLGLNREELDSISADNREGLIAKMAPLNRKSWLLTMMENENLSITSIAFNERVPERIIERIRQAVEGSDFLYRYAYLDHMDGYSTEELAAYYGTYTERLNGGFYVIRSYLRKILPTIVQEELQKVHG